MDTVGEPGTRPQHIDGGRREKGLQPELFEANIACSSHLTGAHGLRNRPFDSCSCGILLPKCGRFLAFARRHQSGVGRFIWA